MCRKLCRRQFIRASGGSVAALVLTACDQQETSPAAQQAADEGGLSPPVDPPSPPPVKVLPPESLLEFLDRRAEFNMQRCHHCAQATFLSLQEGFGLPGDDILKALTPLPGIAERGETCGAVIGALMALGLVFGREQLGDMAAWRASLKPARTFCARFEQEFGSTQCGDLVEKFFGKRYDLADPFDHAEFLAARPGPSEICGRVVKTAVRFAAELVLEQSTAARYSCS